ncbi:hypothetical protein SAMN05216505_104133 [Streptomyces prasinopilosus]|uniref:Uncharacterized protein n=1 Tax=Streptomyces prasinopilosus TaxID=67344 RepID=A0A1G6QHE6_9ACTN|nr:hypothetical protein SAMN05216505_104133 [Streptomyces prasinopilosus]
MPYGPEIPFLERELRPYATRVTKNTTLRPEEITPENLDAAPGIRVRPGQEFAVAPVVKSLAEAYVHPGPAWLRLAPTGSDWLRLAPTGSDWLRLIMDGDRAAGFLTAFPGIDRPEDGGSVVRPDLRRLSSAAEEQGGGAAASPRSRSPPGPRPGRQGAPCHLAPRGRRPGTLPPRAGLPRGRGGRRGGDGRGAGPGPTAARRGPARIAPGPHAPLPARVHHLRRARRPRPARIGSGARVTPSRARSAPASSPSAASSPAAGVR